MQIGDIVVESLYEKLSKATTHDEFVLTLTESESFVFSRIMTHSHSDMMDQLSQDVKKSWRKLLASSKISGFSSLEVSSYSIQYVEDFFSLNRADNMLMFDTSYYEKSILSELKMKLTPYESAEMFTKYHDLLMKDKSLNFVSSLVKREDDIKDSLSLALYYEFVDFMKSKRRVG